MNITLDYSFSQEADPVPALIRKNDETRVLLDEAIGLLMRIAHLQELQDAEIRVLAARRAPPWALVAAAYLCCCHAISNANNRAALLLTTMQLDASWRRIDRLGADDREKAA